MSQYKKTLFTSILFLPLFLLIIYLTTKKSTLPMIAFSSPFLISILLLDPSLRLRKELPLLSFFGIVTLWLRPYFFLQDQTRSKALRSLFRVGFISLLVALSVYLAYGIPSDMRIAYLFFTYKRAVLAAFAGTLVAETMFPLSVALFPKT